MSKLTSIFIGNIPNAKPLDIIDLFSKHGKVEKVDLKSGYAFAYMSEGANDAVGELNEINFQGHRIRVQFARGDGNVKRREDYRRRKLLNPNPHLFVIGFDERSTGTDDLKNLFSEYGDVDSVNIRRTFGFVKFTTTDEAIRAKDALNGSTYHDRMLSVEFVSEKINTRSDRPRQRSRTRSRDRDYRKRSRSYERNYRRSRSPERRYSYDRSPKRSRYSRSRSFDRRRY